MVWCLLLAEAHNRSRGILTSVSHSGNRCAAATLDLATTPLQAFTFAVVNVMHASQMIYAAYAVCMQTKPPWKCSSRRSFFRLRELWTRS